MLTLHVGACVLGLLLLARSADTLVLSSAALAERIGVPAVFVGVVVIGFGTSAPELLVSGLAAWSGSPAIGVGNVIGSNIANLSLVLGAAAMVAPVGVHVRVIRREVPLAVLATLVFGIAVQDGITRAEAVGMFALLAGCLALLLHWSVGDRTAPADHADGRGASGTAGISGTSGGEDAPGAEGAELLAAEVDDLLVVERPRSLRTLGRGAALGLAGTLAGGQALVWGAVGVARGMHLSEGFVGVSIVAVGTSLPELVTAAQASRRGESDLVVGNLLGSNLFNALAVGGLIGILRPGAVVGRPLAVTGVLVMLAVSALALIFMVRGVRVVRWEAAVLVAVFVACLPLMAGGPA